LFRVFWRIPPPKVTRVDPASVPFGMDTHITITGSDFIDVRGVVPAADFVVDASKTSISAHILGSTPSGCYNIGVRTDTGTSDPPNTVKFCVTPIVNNVAPTSGPFTGDTTVTVSGAGFEIPSVNNPRGTSILVGGRDAGPAACSATTCTVTTPRGSPGDADVRACVLGACSTTSATFHYTGPAIMSFSPSHGPITGGTWVEIGGVSLPQDGSTQIFFDDIQAPQLDGCGVPSDTCIRALSPSHRVGSVPITVRIAGNTGPPSAAPGVFTYDPQAVLTAFGYDQGRLDPGWITLNGFAPGPAGAPVSIVSSDPAALLQPTTVTVPAGSSGANFRLNFLPIPRTETVTLTASYGGATFKATVTLAASPALSVGIGVDHLAQGERTLVTITLNTPAPANPAGGAVVMLSSSDPSAIAVPPNVIVPTGSQMKSFSITNNYSGTPKAVTIAATYNATSASNSLFVPTTPPTPPPDCTHCGTPQRCCVCNGGTWNRGRCE